MIVGCIICEIVLLGITAVRTACTIASEFGYRLYPLNQERYFVATALIRACFGMLHSLCRKCASIVTRTCICLAWTTISARDMSTRLLFAHLL
jgi:hypothetical protein